MESRILRVFYGNDCLPYKDVERKVHYPIVGNTFVGANNTTQIRFYVDRIGGTENVKWIAVSKLPNGQIGNEILDNEKVVYDEELNETYIALDLTKFYTSLKGDVAISLNGYEGGINLAEDSETGILTIYGTPTIQATGVVIITINYAPQVLPTTNFNFSNLQLILAELANKLDKINGFYVVEDLSQLDLSNFTENQIFYDLATNNFVSFDGEGLDLIDILPSKANASALGDQVRYSFSNGTLTITSK